MPRGGKRPGAGRKAQGITRKVSLTLTAEEWKRIEESEHETVAAYIKHLMNEVTKIKEGNKSLKNKVTQIKIEKGSINEIGNYNHTRKLVEELWRITIDNWKYDHEDPLPDQKVLESAKESLFGVLFPSGEDTAKIETKTQYICPFTNKRFGSFENLVRSAIPRLIKSASKKVT